MPKARESQNRRNPFNTRDEQIRIAETFSYGRIIARQKARGWPYRFRTETYTVYLPDRPGPTTITATTLDVYLPTHGGWMPMRGNYGYSRRVPLPH